MQAGFPVSVEEVRQMVRAKGGSLACPMCGGEGFTMEEVSVLASRCPVSPPHFEWSHPHLAPCAHGL